MRIDIAVLLLITSAGSAVAQEKPKLALRLESKQGNGIVRIAVSFENLTSVPVTLRDSASPEFEPWTWLKIAIDGKDTDLRANLAFAQFFDKFKTRTIAAKGRMLLGDIAVVPQGTPPFLLPADAPIALAAPGEHAIRVSLQDRRTEFGSGAETITVQVPLADADAKTHTFKMVKECAIKADVYRLAGDEVRPVIVWIHGGALITGHRGGMNAVQRQRYLAAGYVVVSIDYRLAPETKLAGIIDDVRDAFKWVREKGPELYKIDPKRVAVVGHSAGGYLTLMSGFAVEPRPQALVAFYGYGDITNEWYSKPDSFYRMRPLVTKEEAYKGIGTVEVSEGKTPERGRFYLYCRQNGLWPKEVAGLDPDKEPRAFDCFCPIRNVTKDYPPTLLLHGDNDTDVPHRQSVDMANELKKHGVTHEFISIKNGPHGFDGGKGMQDAKVQAAFDRVLVFLKRHTQR